MQVGLWAWLGFIFPVSLGASLCSGKDKGLVWLLFLVQTGHSLIGILVMGAILRWMEITAGLPDPLSQMHTTNNT